MMVTAFAPPCTSARISGASCYRASGMRMACPAAVWGIQASRERQGLGSGDRVRESLFGEGEHALLVDGRPEVEGGLAHRHPHHRVTEARVEIHLRDERLASRHVGVGPRVE